MEYCSDCKYDSSNYWEEPCHSCAIAGNGQNDNFEPVEDKPIKVDMVNHPPHYERAGATECIEELKQILTEEQFKGFLLGNIWKYRYRAADKNGAEDIKKSDWYMSRYIDEFGHF